jgi:hypothetical protein
MQRAFVSKRKAAMVPRWHHFRIRNFRIDPSMSTASLDARKSCASSCAISTRLSMGDRGQ